MVRCRRDHEQRQLVNAGTITGSGQVALAAIDNTGLIEASAGLLTVSAAIRDAGRLRVDAGATLNLAGTIAATWTVALAPTGLLQLDAASANAAIVSPGGGAVQLLGGGAATLDAADTHLTVTLLQAGALTLSQQPFITATGSSGNDRLVALAAGQHLTGGHGADTLIGAAMLGDLFIDTATGLNGDTIDGFAGTNAIEVTDPAPGAGLSLSYVQQAASGMLTLAEGRRSTAITLIGIFDTNEFTIAGASNGGLLIGLSSDAHVAG